MNYKIFVFTSIITLIINNNLFSQSKTIDSLFNELNKANKLCSEPCPKDSNVALIYLQIGDYFEKTNPDTAIFFYKKALNTSKSINNNELEAKSLLYIGYVIEHKGNNNEPLKYYYSAIELLELTNNTKDIAAANNSIGTCFYNQGNYQKAIENMLKALHYYEKTLSISTTSTSIFDSKRGICASLSNIGCVQSDMENFDIALNYHNKALKTYIELSKSKIEKEKYFGTNGISNCYTNIGNIYYYQAKYKLALDYYRKSLKIKKELNLTNGICLLYNNIGNIYGQLGEYAQAIKTFENSLNSYKELDDSSGLALVNGNISALYIILADSMAFSQSAKQNYLNKAILYGLTSYNISNKTHSVPQINEASSQLRVAYKKLGDLENANYFSDVYIDTKDSIFKEEKTRAIAEMEAQYQNEKKQLQIENYKKTSELNLNKIKQQRILLFLFILGFVIILLFATWLAKLYKDKKKANEILAIQNTEIKQQREEISSQRDEIESQRDFVTIQKNKIEEIHETLTSSIRYAQQIQDAALTSNEQISNIFSNYFVLFLPKDIVSGDFYWITKIKKNSIFCVADCTGHGVPGAFMSMLGISLLNEIVRKEEITNAAEVLNCLRENIIIALKQKNTNYSENKVKDGMDISLCVLNNETLNLQFAGANNPLWIIRKFENLKMNQFENEKGKNIDSVPPLLNYQINEFSNLIELKGDKMPIAIYLHMEPFTQQEIQLQKGDLLYLFSDGYADQFGGLENKKFRYKKFKELLLNNADKQMSEQKTIIENTLIKWKANNIQVDDITILGIKV